MSGRGVADWKGALLTLEDGPFFDLMRGYLGDIKTPFNKQRLVDDLAGFLSRREIQDEIALFLGPSDRRVLAALFRLGDPTAVELTSFFDGELSYAELYGLLINLEERLLIYRYVDQGQRRIAINPILSPLFEEIRNAPFLLFVSRPRSGLGPAENPEPALSGGLLAAVISFIYKRPDLFKADGLLRKKVADELEAILPFPLFAKTLSALRALGVVQVRSLQARVDENRLKALSLLSPADLQVYLASALCAAEQGGLAGFSVETESSATVEPSMASALVRAHRDRLSSWARLLRLFLDSLDPSLAYPEATLMRLLDIQERSGAPSRRRHWASSRDEDEVHPTGSPAESRRTAVRALASSGCLVPLSEGCFALPETDPPVPKAGGNLITIDSAFSVLAYPELPLPDALSLARFLDIREAGTLYRYELSRETAVRAFDRSISAEDISTTLVRLAGRPLPQNISWSLAEWQSRYSSVSLHRGVVLVISEDRRYLLSTEGIASLVQRELAPGVYLLCVSEESEAVRALERAGVDVIAQPFSKPQVSAFHEAHSLPPLPPASHPQPAQLPDDLPSFPDVTEEVESRISKLKMALEKKGLPKDQKDALTSRIDRRVILNESQLAASSVRYEKLEAKGLDYVGKVRVAEQAISTLSLLEVFWRGSRGEPQHLIASPRSLEKASGEVELVLETIPPTETLRVPVGKISVLRRIKRSVFGE